MPVLDYQQAQRALWSRLPKRRLLIALMIGVGAGVMSVGYTLGFATTIPVLSALAGGPSLACLIVATERLHVELSDSTALLLLVGGIIAQCVCYSLIAASRFRRKLLAVVAAVLFHLACSAFLCGSIQ